MEFPLERIEPEHPHYDREALSLAYEFTKSIHKELGTIVRAVVLFGSATEKEHANDVDLLVIIDDIQIAFTPELQQAYRVITETVVRSISSRLHITTLRFSNFWEYVRTSDPVIVTVLRSGKALIDTGFFAPLQLLLQQGRIRPSMEAIWAYYSKAPQVILASKFKVLMAVMDLYWAVVDSAHAALMSVGVVPETPGHIAGLLKQKFVKKGLLEDKHPKTVTKFYKLQKDIGTRQLKYVSGARYDKLAEEADDFVKRMRLFLE